MKPAFIRSNTLYLVAALLVGSSLLPCKEGKVSCGARGISSVQHPSFRIALYAFDRSNFYEEDLKPRGIIQSDTQDRSGFLKLYFLHNDSLRMLYPERSPLYDRLVGSWYAPYVHRGNPNFQNEKWFRYGEWLTDTLIVHFEHDCPDYRDTLFVNFVTKPNPAEDCRTPYDVYFDSLAILYRSVYGDWLYPNLSVGGLGFTGTTIHVVLPCKP